jgi:ArsR family transcriptional regulator
MLTPNTLFDLLSDETRSRCLMLLMQNNELCVCEFCHVLGTIQPKISRHLAIMRTSGLISDERRGQWVYYQINPTLRSWILNIITTTFQELKQIEPYRSDLKKAGKLCKENLCC